jgi:TonB family protein
LETRSDPSSEKKDGAGGVKLRLWVMGALVLAAALGGGSAAEAKKRRPATPAETMAYARTVKQQIIQSFQKQLSGRAKPYQLQSNLARVYVRFDVSAKGKVISAKIVQSSGDLETDRVLLETVRRSGPFTPTPTGATTNFTQPFCFRHVRQGGSLQTPAGAN